jgi:anaerobic magnesium-protoporphyrin IX monomethyl ester cyclase
MRILLVNPPLSPMEVMPQSLARPRRRGPLRPRALTGTMPSMSLLYLSPPLRAEGHAVRYFEGYFEGQEALMQLLRKDRFDVIGISVYTHRWPVVRRLIADIKALAPHCVVVVGGVHATVRRGELLEECPGLDFVMAGEAEETFPRLVTALEKGHPYEGIPGLVWREDGGVRDLGQTPFCKDLDALAFPDRGLVRLEAYRPSALFHRRLPHTSVFGSRGCPYSCIFCHTDRHVRLRSAVSIADEVEEAHRGFGARDITFWDDSFSLDRDRVLELCCEIRARALDVTWCANLRVDQVDLDMLEAMRRAGCWRVLYGLETGVQKNLETLRKGTSVAQGTEAVFLAKKAGLQVLGMFMFGIPGESYEEGLETIRYALRLPLDLISVTNITPFPGTALERMACSAGRIVESAAYDMDNITFVPHSMRAGELEALMRTAYRRFYLRPSYILRRLGTVRSLADLRHNIEALITLLSA